MVNKNYGKLETCIKKHVWQRIAKEMSDITNTIYTAIQVDTKWKGLVKTYKDIQINNNTSGKSRKHWRYYDWINEILFNKQEIQAVATCSSHKGLVVRKDLNNQCDSPNENQPNNEQIKTENEEKGFETSFSKKRKRRELDYERRHREKMEKIDKLQKNIGWYVTMGEKQIIKAVIFFYFKKNLFAIESILVLTMFNFYVIVYHSSSLSSVTDCRQLVLNLFPTA